jgi:peptide deformylase
MNEDDILDLSVTAAQINTGEFNPYDKYVSTDSSLAEHVDFWNVELVEPKHAVMNRPANVDPFSNKEIDWRHREQDLIALMNINHGLGLAAPQIGSSYRMFVMKHSHLGDIGIYNPEIVKYSDTQVTWQEGCLSFPMLFLSVQRPEEITVRYTKADGDTRIEVRMDGRDARIFLHEYDHLQGTVFLDHVSLLKLNRAKEQRKKLFKKFRKAQKQHS